MKWPESFLELIKKINLTAMIIKGEIRLEDIIESLYRVPEVLIPLLENPQIVYVESGDKKLQVWPGNFSSYLRAMVKNKRLTRLEYRRLILRLSSDRFVILTAECVELLLGYTDVNILPADDTPFSLLGNRAIREKKSEIEHMINEYLARRQSFPLLELVTKFPSTIPDGGIFGLLCASKGFESVIKDKYKIRLTSRIKKIPHTFDQHHVLWLTMNRCPHRHPKTYQDHVPLNNEQIAVLISSGRLSSILHPLWTMKCLLRCLKENKSSSGVCALFATIWVPKHIADLSDDDLIHLIIESHMIKNKSYSHAIESNDQFLERITVVRFLEYQLPDFKGVYSVAKSILECLRLGQEGHESILLAVAEKVPAAFENMMERELVCSKEFYSDLMKKYYDNNHIIIPIIRNSDIDYVDYGACHVMQHKDKQSMTQHVALLIEYNRIDFEGCKKLYPLFPNSDKIFGNPIVTYCKKQYPNEKLGNTSDT
jgi:hypothetical protein